MNGVTREKEISCDGTPKPPAALFQYENSVCRGLSSITHPMIGTPDQFEGHLQPLEMGQPPTPPCQSLVIVNESLLN